MECVESGMFETNDTCIWQLVSVSMCVCVCIFTALFTKV